MDESAEEERASVDVGLGSVRQVTPFSYPGFKMSTVGSNKPQSNLFKRKPSNAALPPRPLNIFNSQSFNKLQIGSTLFKPLKSPIKPHEVKKCLFEGPLHKENDPSGSILCQPLNSNQAYTGSTPALVRCTASSASVEPTFKENHRRSLLGKRNNSAFKFAKPAAPAPKPSMRPLFCSSPNSDSNIEKNGREELQLSDCSFGKSHPFGNMRPSCGDETFMTRDVCELNTWSVFKSKNPDARRSVFVSPPVPVSSEDQEIQPNYYSSKVKTEQSANNPSAFQTPVTRPTPASSSSTVNPWAKSKVNPFELKRPLFPALTPVTSSSKETDRNLAASNPFLPLFNSSKKVTPVKSPAERNWGLASKELKSLTQPMGDESALDLLGVSPPKVEEVASDHDSTSSFIMNESTINNTLVPPLSVSKAPALDVIHEGHSRESEVADLINFSQGEDEVTTVECDEVRSDEFEEVDDDESNEDEEATDTLGEVVNLMSELGLLRNQIDSLSCEYNEKWNKLKGLVEGLASSQRHVLGLSKAFKSVNLTRRAVHKSSKKRKKVVSTKIRRTPKPLTPSRLTPSMSGRKMKASSVYTSLRASYSVLRTPEESAVKKKQLRKSVCYTPHSLSVRVGGQLNDIFGSN